jgi:hypothetical protein
MNIEFNGLGVFNALSLSIAVVVSAVPATSYAHSQKPSLSIAESTKQLN